MAGPSAKARLPGIERYLEQVLPQPLAKGIARDEVRHYLAKPLSNNAIEAWTDHALLRFIVDKTHPG